MLNRIRRATQRNEFLCIALIIIVGIAFSIANPFFFSAVNLFDLLKMCVMPGIFACGVMMVLINGGIDFSFLWIGMFSAYSTSKLYSMLQQQNNFSAPLPLIFLTSVVIGVALGSINALVISKFRIPVFIATLSTANVFMGLMFQFIGSEYIFPEQMPTSMIGFSNTLLFARPANDGTLVGLHISVIIAITMMIIMHFILRHTLMGRSVYALGGDESAAQRIGFNLFKVRIFIYSLAGAIYGLAGAVAVSNIQVANPYDFQGRELTVIAAVVIGGTKITGGSGSIAGVALGVLLTSVISQNLVLIGVPPEYNKFVFGLLIIFATIMQSLQEKFMKRAVMKKPANVLQKEVAA